MVTGRHHGSGQAGLISHVEPLERLAFSKLSCNSLRFSVSAVEFIVNIHTESATGLVRLATYCENPMPLLKAKHTTV